MRLPFFDAPFLDVLSLREAARRGVETRARAEVIPQVQSRADLRVLTQVVEILRVHANAELRFEISPAATIRRVNRIRDRLRSNRGLQGIVRIAIESNGDC